MWNPAGDFTTHIHVCLASIDTNLEGLPTAAPAHTEVQTKLPTELAHVQHSQSRPHTRKSLQAQEFMVVSRGRCFTPALCFSSADFMLDVVSVDNR